MVFQGIVISTFLISCMTDGNHDLHIFFLNYIFWRIGPKWWLYYVWMMTWSIFINFWKMYLKRFFDDCFVTFFTFFTFFTFWSLSLYEHNTKIENDDFSRYEWNIEIYQKWIKISTLSLSLSVCVVFSNLLTMHPCVYM